MLIFTVGIGEGHNKVAEAIKEEIPEAKVIDILRYISENVHKLIKNTYLNTIKHTPSLWRYSYQRGEKLLKDLEIENVLSKIVATKLKKLLEQEKPKKIICTHAFAAALMSYLKPKYNYKLYSIITDYTVHPMWIQENVDKYFLPDEDIFISKKLEEEKIYFYGMPVRNGFYKQTKNSKNTILIAGGGFGIGSLKDIANELVREPYKVIVLTGRNEKLRKEIESIQDEKITAVGYTDNVVDYYDDAKIVVTKPGGVTSTELIIRNRPTIIYDIIPGQEEYNADYLLKWGVSLKANKKEDIATLIKFLLKNEIRYQQMVEAAAYLASRNRKTELIQEILND